VDEPAPAAAEFDHVLTPPVNPEGLSHGPISVPDGRPVPAGLAEPSLPTRSPGRGPDGGPDRMAPAGAGPTVTPHPVAPTSSPSALQSALAAFDSRRNGGDAALPTRSRGDGTSAPAVDESASTTQSRLDPDALRERLRAFQHEFRVATDGGGTDDDSPTFETTNADLGGDRR
jgi:hypothetical protein